MCVHRGFNLAIEFGPVHARPGGGWLGTEQMFQSRNRVWAGSRLGLRRQVEGAVAVSISQSSLGRFTLEMNIRKIMCRSMFQSRNRVWAGSRREWYVAHADGNLVSISQSSLGRFTRVRHELSRYLATRFNLAIEFGPVHASIPQ